MKRETFKGINLVAVYGTLRAGFGNNARCLKTSEHLTTETVKGLGMVSLSAFPAVYTSKDPDKEITIEVWRTPSDAVNQGLDSLEGYPGFYHRKLIDTSQGKAWIYFIDTYTDESPNQVENGDWKEYLGQLSSSRAVSRY
jgi:gamma-glutamylcyclotransferase (GGCT)/AIG2-like uncharacterized protein YtfP